MEIKSAKLEIFVKTAKLKTAKLLKVECLVLIAADFIEYMNRMAKEQKFRKISNCRLYQKCYIKTKTLTTSNYIFALNSSILLEKVDLIGNHQKFGRNGKNGELCSTLFRPSKLAYTQFLTNLEKFHTFCAILGRKFERCRDP